MLKEQERQFAPQVYLLDCISAVVSFLFAILILMRVPEPLRLPFDKHLAALPALVMAVAFCRQFLYRRRAPWSQKTGALVLDSAVPSLCAAGIFALFVPASGLPLRVLFFALLSVLFALPVSLAGRMAFLAFVRLEQKKGKWIKHILLVGTGKQARAAASRVDGHPGWGLELVGFLTREKDEVGTIISNHKVIGLVEDLPGILGNVEVDKIYFAGDSGEEGQIDGIAALCKEAGKDFVPHAPGL